MPSAPVRVDVRMHWWLAFEDHLSKRRPREKNMPNLQIRMSKKRLEHETLPSLPVQSLSTRHFNCILSICCYLFARPVRSRTGRALPICPLSVYRKPLDSQMGSLRWYCVFPCTLISTEWRRNVLGAKKQRAENRNRRRKRSPAYNVPGAAQCYRIDKHRKNCQTKDVHPKRLPPKMSIRQVSVSG